MKKYYVYYNEQDLSVISVRDNNEPCKFNIDGVIHNSYIEIDEFDTSKYYVVIEKDDNDNIKATLKEYVFE